MRTLLSLISIQKQLKYFWKGVTWFLGRLKISLCEERRLKDTQNLKFEDKRFQNCLVLKTEDSATKPSKPEYWRSELLNGKIWLLCVINWEDSSWWCLLFGGFITLFSVSHNTYKWKILIDEFIASPFFKLSWYTYTITLNRRLLRVYIILCD